MRQSARWRDQPAGFWLGVGLVAEVPAMAVTACLPADTRDAVMAAVFTSPARAVTALVVVMLLYGSVAWLSLRLGLGG